MATIPHAQPGDNEELTYHVMLSRLGSLAAVRPSSPDSSILPDVPLHLERGYKTLRRFGSQKLFEFGFGSFGSS